MVVLCAWCEKEGTENILRTIEGPENQISHGICETHQETMLREIEKLKSSQRAANPRRRRRRR